MSESFGLKNLKTAIGEIAKQKAIYRYDVSEKEEQFSGDNFTTKTFRVQIIEKKGEYDDKHKKTQQINLFVKITNLSKEIRDKLTTFSIYETEYKAYTEFLPLLDKYQRLHPIPYKKRFVYPKFYKGSVKELQEYMILEDLSCDGYKMYGKRNPLDYKHSKVIVKHLARFHAVSFAMKHKDPKQFNSLVAKMHNEREFSDFHRDMCVNMTNKVVDQLDCERKKKLIVDFVSDTKHLLRYFNSPKLTEPYNTVTHGDFHINNMLFKTEDGKLKLMVLDWQMMRMACPANDLSQCFYMATDKQFRDAHLRQLFDLYYATLQKSLGMYGCDVAKLYPRSVFEANLIDTYPNGILSTILCTAFFLTNPGEEFTLDQAMSESNKDLKISANEEIKKRLEGAVEDIERYKLLRNYQ